MPVSVASNTQEADRLQRLRELLILDSTPEPVFESIARMASDICGVPIALISLIDEERQWIMANVGMAGVSETPRDVAFCDYTIRGDSVVEVPDARADSRFADNPFVTGEEGIRFYAGAPLILPGGQRVGTLCVIDRAVHHLTDAQVAMLSSLAAIATQTLVLRRDLVQRTLDAAAEQERAVAARERFIRQIVDSLPTRIAYVDKSLRYRFVNQAHCERFALSRYEILGHTRAELKFGDVDPAIEDHVRAVFRGETQHFEFDECVLGKPRRIESVLIPDVLANGEVIGFFSTGTDITEHVATARALGELAEILHNTTDFVTQIDRRGQVVYMNPAARRATGIDIDAPLAGIGYEQFNTPETLRLHASVILPALQTSGVWLGETTVYGANKREIPVSHMVIAHRDESGRIERYSTVMRDVTTELQAKRDASRQMSKLRAVTEAIPESVAVVDADFRYRFVNSAFEHWISASREKLIGQTMSDVLGPEAFSRHLPWLQRAMAGEPVSFESSLDSEGGVLHVSISHSPLRGDNGSVDGVVTVTRDISLQRREETRLREISQRDPLTGLLNRAGLEQYLAGALSGSTGKSLALLYIDLDHFKPVNDQYGHAMGDQLLARFASRLRKAVRPTDGVARMGGDEFAIVLPGMSDPDSARAVASKVIAAATQPFVMAEGVQLVVGASVGIAFGSAAMNDLSTLVSRADANLYKAKSGGRGRHADDTG